MLEFLYQILLWYSLGAGLVVTLAGLFGMKPNLFAITLSIGAVAGLVVQLIVSIVLTVSGERAAISTIEFFGYLIVALLLPALAAAWSLAERTKWSTVILGAASLTIAVMLVRMMQIWTGVNPVTMVGA